MKSKNCWQVEAVAAAVEELWLDDSLDDDTACCGGSCCYCCCYIVVLDPVRCQVVCNDNRWPPHYLPGDGQKERWPSSTEASKKMTKKKTGLMRNHPVASLAYWAWAPELELEVA